MVTSPVAADTSLRPKTLLGPGKLSSSGQSPLWKRACSDIAAALEQHKALVKALHDAGGNRVQAAAALGIARSSLYRKLQSFGISTI